MAYLGKNIKYPTIAQENGTQGRVIIQFVVERDGSITDVQMCIRDRFEAKRSVVVS